MDAILSDRVPACAAPAAAGAGEKKATCSEGLKVGERTPSRARRNSSGR